MLNYKKLEVDIVEYAKLKQIQLENNTDIREHIIGSRKKLYARNMLIATTTNVGSLDIGDLTKFQFNSFLGGFNKSLYNQFRLYPNLYNKKIDFKGVARSKNIDKWEAMSNGTFFYNIDIRSAYWQIAHRLGYISDNLFNSYLDIDSYKQAKRYCISFLARTNRMEFTFNNDKYIIICDTTALRQVYNNIRNELYKVVQESLEDINDWIEYNIDGVSVYESDLSKITSHFTKHNIKYKITECKKLSDKEYSYNGYIRHFVRRKALKPSNI